MTTVVADRAPVAAGQRPRIRHGFLAAALLGVAGLRAMSGDWIWAAVLGLGAAAELGVLLLARRRAAASDRAAPAPTGGHPAAEVVRRSELGHRQAQRMWLALVVLTTGAGLGLVLTAPSLAAVLGILSLVALARLRRERRSVQRLQALHGREIVEDR